MCLLVAHRHMRKCTPSKSRNGLIRREVGMRKCSGTVSRPSRLCVLKIMSFDASVLLPVPALFRADAWVCKQQACISKV